MCDIRVQMPAQMQTLSRRGSSTSCRSGVKRASASCSRRSVRSNGGCVGSGDGLPVPACMKPCRAPSNTGLCCNQARPDCCRVPCCPPLPKCPLGIYVERVQPIRPDRRYEPPSFPFEALSSYREQFFPKCGDRAKSFKPYSTFEASSAKMDGLSTYRQAFTPKPLCGVQKPPWAKAAEFEPSSAKFDGITTYRGDYVGCMGERVKSLKPYAASFDPSAAKMDGITTYRTNYIPYCSREYDYAKQQPYKKQVSAAFSCAKMEGLSTYRSDFWPKCGTKRRSMKPSVRARYSDATFADRTTYRNDFVPFHFQKCVGQCIPAEVYDEMYPCDTFACGLTKDPPLYSQSDDVCAGSPPAGLTTPCCPIMVSGNCGNEMGLIPGKCLPECCQPDPVPPAEGGDC